MVTVASVRVRAGSTPNAAGLYEPYLALIVDGREINLVELIATTYGLCSDDYGDILRGFSWVLRDALLGQLIATDEIMTPGRADVAFSRLPDGRIRLLIAGRWGGQAEDDIAAFYGDYVMIREAAMLLYGDLCYVAGLYPDQGGDHLFREVCHG